MAPCTRSVVYVETKFRSETKLNTEVGFAQLLVNTCACLSSIMCVSRVQQCVSVLRKINIQVYTKTLIFHACGIRVSFKLRLICTV